MIEKNRKSSKISLRNPRVALAATFEMLAQKETNALNRLQRLREAKKLREKAREEPPSSR